MRLFLIILILFTITSCNKTNNENTQTFKGVVFDYSTNARAPNTIIKLIRHEGFWQSGYLNPVFDSAITNANGEYEIIVDKATGKSFYNIETYKPGYSSAKPFCLPRAFYGLLTSGQNTYYDTSLVDKSTIVTTLINNILPANVNDTLDFSIWRGKTCNSGPPISDYIRIDKQFIGIVTNQYFSDTFSLKSSPLVSISWTVRNNGIISTNEQTITPVEFGTTNFILNY
jgi:hypothetical protein